MHKPYQLLFGGFFFLMAVFISSLKLLCFTEDFETLYSILFYRASLKTKKKTLRVLI